MASTYALPGSAMAHGHGHHHGNGHLHSHSHSHSQSPSHSHSHSPSGQYPANTVKALRQEGSNGSLHSHSHSEPGFDHGHSHNHSHSGSHRHRHQPTADTQSSALPPTAAWSEKQNGHMNSYEPPLDDVKHTHGHSHSHSSSLEPRSKFTGLLLPMVQRWPLLHTILAAKDSRRIFYFMRYVTALSCQ